MIVLQLHNMNDKELEMSIFSQLTTQSTNNLIMTQEGKLFSLTVFAGEPYADGLYIVDKNNGSPLKKVLDLKSSSTSFPWDMAINKKTDTIILSNIDNGTLCISDKDGKTSLAGPDQNFPDAGCISIEFDEQETTSQDPLSGFHSVCFKRNSDNDAIVFYNKDLKRFEEIPYPKGLNLYSSINVFNNNIYLTGTGYLSIYSKNARTWNILNRLKFPSSSVSVDFTSNIIIHNNKLIMSMSTTNNEFIIAESADNGMSWKALVTTDKTLPISINIHNNYIYAYNMTGNNGNILVYNLDNAKHNTFNISSMTIPDAWSAKFCFDEQNHKVFIPTLNGIMYASTEEIEKAIR